MIFIEEKCELGDFSVNIDIKNSTKLVNPLFNLLFWVSLSTFQSSMSNKLGNRTILQSLLSASNLDIDGDSSLVAWPVFSGDSHTVAKFTYSCGSWALKSLWNFSEWQLSEINQSFLTELEIFSSWWCLILGLWNLRKSSSQLKEFLQRFWDFIHH